MHRGQTVSQTGPAFFAHCKECGKLTTVNSLYGAPDFPGDVASIEFFPNIRCSDCARGYNGWKYHLRRLVNRTRRV